MASNPQATIVTTGAGVLALHIVAAGLNGEAPAARRVIGTGVVTIGLSYGANYAPGPCAAMAVLWGVTTLFTAGTPIFKAISTTTKSPTAKAAAKAPAKPVPIII